MKKPNDDAAVIAGCLVLTMLLAGAACMAACMLALLLVLRLVVFVWLGL